MRSLLAAGLLVVSFCQTATSTGFSGGLEAPAEPVREEILTCALDPSLECHNRLTELIATTEDEAVRKLITVVLEEWTLDPTDSQFEDPRLVWIPLPTFGELEELLPETVKLDFLVLSGKVLPDGGLIEPEILRPGVNSAAFDEAVRISLARALFRPARVEGTYIAKQAELLLRVHPSDNP